MNVELGRDKFGNLFSMKEGRHHPPWGGEGGITFILIILNILVYSVGYLRHAAVFIVVIVAVFLVAFVVFLVLVIVIIKDSYNKTAFSFPCSLVFLF
jgi:hypothetical protein